jgi:hypothetical protein
MWRPVPKVFCTSFLMENRFVQTLCNTESIMNKKSGNGSRWSVTVNVIFVTENAGWNAHRTRFSLSFHHYVSETVKCSEKQEDEYSHSKCQKFSIGHSFITGRFSPWLGFAPRSAHVICVVGKNGTETGFSPSSSVSPISIIPSKLHIVMYNLRYGQCAR